MTPVDTLKSQMTYIVSSYGFREETVDVSGVSVHCVIKDPVVADIPETINDASNDVFVFIHGTASTSVSLFEVMKNIPSNIKCVAFDVPNFGISDNIDIDTYTSNEDLCIRYADIIGNTLIKLGIVKNTILIGHSLGAFLSIYTADRFPIKKLILLKPVGILPTLGIYGYYWAIFFKMGLPMTLFHLPMISRELLIYTLRLILNLMSADTPTQHKLNDFWVSFFANNENTGHEILQRFITFSPFYSFWNTPTINTLLDVYKKVPTHICFGENDTIIPSHIGDFLNELTRGELMIHNIKNEHHIPCCNIEYLLKNFCQVNSETETETETETSRRRIIHKKNQGLCRGYSYPLLEKTHESFQNVYDYLLTNTTCCPPHSA